MAIKLKDRIEANIRQSDKVNSSLSIQLNSGIATVYNGSSAKTVNITPAAIGAPSTDGTGATGDWNIHIQGYSRGITQDFLNTLVISKNQGALITAYCDGITNWAMERRGSEKQIGAHYYDTTNGNWLEEHILLDHVNYSGYALPLNGGTMTGPITFANNTWNPVGDDAALGDHNQAGAICFKALNHNETSLILYNPSETATGIIKLNGSNNLILHADGGVIYSSGTFGIEGANSIYFDTTAASRGIVWHHYQSGKTAPHILQFLSGANDGANAANGYWGDIQMHANSDTNTTMYVTRWQDGVEQGRICLLDQWNNTWKTSGSFYLQNNGSLVCQWNNNGTMQTGITIWADGEGGNIEFFSPNGNRFQIDAYNGNWRLYGIVNNAYSGEITVTPYGQLYGAVWNDYAEFRKTTYTKPGHVVVEKGDGSLCQSWDRLLPGCEIVSDTYGFAIGETEECKTPIAVSGRVLAYPYEDRESYQPGDAVCSAPGGCVSRMTRQEITMYPERIIGTVSEIPEYNTWGEKDVKVDGRIWIRIR